jgi:hypothetical protein
MLCLNQIPLSGQLVGDGYMFTAKGGRKIIWTNRKQIERGIIAIVGSVAVVFVGTGVASVLELNDWIGILIVALVFGVVTGTAGVSRGRR